ncbi:hypothetical protein ACYPKM_04020 [Pseudomonas aeruginosa]
MIEKRLPDNSFEGLMIGHASIVSTNQAGVYEGFQRLLEIEASAHKWDPTRPIFGRPNREQTPSNAEGRGNREGLKEQQTILEQIHEH